MILDLQKEEVSPETKTAEEINSEEEVAEEAPPEMLEPEEPSIKEEKKTI